jgi:hypothetical protein
LSNELYGLHAKKKNIIIISKTDQDIEFDEGRRKETQHDPTKKSFLNEKLDTDISMETFSINSITNILTADDYEEEENQVDYEETATQLDYEEKANQIWELEIPSYQPKNTAMWREPYICYDWRVEKLILRPGTGHFGSFDGVISNDKRIPL